jgi:hypothetical protein
MLFDFLQDPAHQAALIQDPLLGLRVSCPTLRSVVTKTCMPVSPPGAPIALSRQCRSLAAALGVVTGPGAPPAEKRRTLLFVRRRVAIALASQSDAPITYADMLRTFAECDDKMHGRALKSLRRREARADIQRCLAGRPEDMPVVAPFVAEYELPRADAIREEMRLVEEFTATAEARREEYRAEVAAFEADEVACQEMKARYGELRGRFAAVQRALERGGVTSAEQDRLTRARDLASRKAREAYEAYEPVSRRFTDTRRNSDRHRMDAGACAAQAHAELARAVADALRAL